MQQTRRTYLAATGALAVGTALAGCLGNGSDDVETSYECDLIERDPVSELPQPRLGPEDAEATVAVFEDFACPGCRNFALGDLADLKADFSDSVAFEHYDFPIPVSDWSERVANAARSVQDEHGDEAFFEFSTAAYENQADYSWQVIGDVADDVGAEPCVVLSDAATETYSAVLDANRTEGQQRDIPETPTVFVDGQEVESSYDAVEAALDVE